MAGPYWLTGVGAFGLNFGLYSMDPRQLDAIIQSKPIIPSHPNLLRTAVNGDGSNLTEREREREREATLLGLSCGAYVSLMGVSVGFFFLNKKLIFIYMNNF